MNYLFHVNLKLYFPKVAVISLKNNICQNSSPRYDEESDLLEMWFSSEVKEIGLDFGA